MIEITKKENCCGCYACYNVCPKNAIDMIEDENGFKVPKINKELCINCGLCDKVCPIKNVKSVLEDEPKAYAAYNKNEKSRIESSSGGIFALIAEYVLSLNGVIFGARFNSNFDVVHDYIEKIEDIEKFKGSKYVQSSIGDSYRYAKKFLDEDRYVLFSGTPCQIEGLKKYLGKEYDKLYTQDIICHGVPSPKVWKKYLEYRKNIDNKKIENINFRDKNNSWEDFGISFEYKGSKYIKSHKEDLYMKTFLKNTCLRESCYACKFKKVSRQSDITLADFWGVDEILKDFNDNKGVSLVLVNSEKGKELFSKLFNGIEYKEVNFKEAIKYNSSMLNSAYKPKNRDKFLSIIEKEKFDIAFKKAKIGKKKNIIIRVLKKIKKIILK